MKIDYVEIAYRFNGEDHTSLSNFDTIKIAKEYFEEMVLTRKNLHFISMMCMVDGEPTDHSENICCLNEHIVRMQTEHFIDCLEEI